MKDSAVSSEKMVSDGMTPLDYKQHLTIQCQSIYGRQAGGNALLTKVLDGRMRNWNRKEDL